jgi:hypothetical protein
VVGLRRFEADADDPCRRSDVRRFSAFGEPRRLEAMTRMPLGDEQPSAQAIISSIPHQLDTTQDA